MFNDEEWQGFCRALGNPPWAEDGRFSTLPGRLENAEELDMLVEESVIVEFKAVENVSPLHTAQLMTYLRLSGLRLGLLINFNVRLIKDGIKRMVL